MVIKNNRLPTEIIMQNLIEQIPNTPLNNEKTNDIIKTEDIFIDNDYINDFNYLPRIEKNLKQK